MEKVVPTVALFAMPRSLQSCMGNVARKIGMPVTQFFPVSQPSIGPKEIEYVTDAVSSGWVSSIGAYIELFESKFAEFCGTRYAVAVSNGTTALHLALIGLGVTPQDEVIIPDLTFVATANAVKYVGARVVVVDIDRDSLCIDVRAVSRAITPKTRAIIPVHLYGHPADMQPLMVVAKEHGVAVIEDAAEAHGATYRGVRVGSIGDAGVFSFYGNKVITSGEGGMITSNSRDLVDRLRFLRDHAMSPTRRYWHTEVGFNYRLTNLQAALAVAQLERIEEFLDKRREIMGWYREELGGCHGLKVNRQLEGCKNAFWMVCLEVDGMDEDRRVEFMRLLRRNGVDSRPYFYPVSDLPMYDRAKTAVTHEIFRKGINLPSYVDLTREDVASIGKIVRSALIELALMGGHAV